MNSLNNIVLYITTKLNFFDFIFLLLLFANLFYVYIISKKIKTLNLKKYNSIPVDIEHDIAILEVIIENYKNNKYNPALKEIKKTYGITPHNDQRYVSIKGYIEDVTSLRQASTLDIINTHIAEPLRHNLSNYFTDESLLLYILDKFAEV